MNIFLTCYLRIEKYPRSQLEFDLLYGRQVRGSLDEDWTADRSSAVPLATYISEMRDQLAEMAYLVAKHSADSQQKQCYDRGAKLCSFEVGDQVLVLLPTVMNRVKLRWTGPYKVTRRVSSVGYEVEMPGRRHEKKLIMLT